MKQHKKFKIIMLVLAGLAILSVAVFCIVKIISNSPSHIAQIVLDGDSDDKLNDKYDKLKSEKKAEVLEIVTTEMQKKTDEYKAGNVTGSFEEYVGDSWHSFEYIITNSSDVEAEKIKEAENVIHNMELIVYGQELISEAENCIDEKDYIEAYKLVEIIEGTHEQAEAEDNEDVADNEDNAEDTDNIDNADNTDDAEDIHEYLCKADYERVTAIKTAISNDAGAYYKDLCKELAEENKYSEVEEIIEQISGICTEEDIAVMQGYIFTREKAFGLYLANPSDYETLLANDEYNYADTVVNYYGYYDVDGDSFDELVFSNINRNEWDTACCYYVDFDEDKKCLETAKPIEYSIVKSGIEWTAFNDSVDWKNAYTDLLLERGYKEDRWEYSLCDIDGNGIPELIVPIRSESAGEYAGTYSYMNGNLKQYLLSTSYRQNTYIYNNNFICFGNIYIADPDATFLDIAICKNGEFVNAPIYDMPHTADGPEHIARSIRDNTSRKILTTTEVTLSDMNEELKQYGVYITSKYDNTDPNHPFYDYSLNFNTDDVIELSPSGDYDASQPADIIESIWNY